MLCQFLTESLCCIYIYTHTHTHICMYICMYVCVYIYVYICIHTHVYVFFFFFKILLSFHHDLSQETGYSSLCCTGRPLGLSILEQRFASTNPTLPVHPTFSSSAWATTSLFSMSVNLFLFCR